MMDLIRTLTVAGALGCSALALTSCTSGPDAGQGADPEGSFTSEPEVGPENGGGAGVGQADLAFASPDADDFNKLLTSEEGLVDLQPVPILGVDATDPDRLIVSFEMESHHCYGVVAAVEETDTVIVLDLQTGRRAGSSPGACTYGVFPYTTAVSLESPVGERSITTAADGAPLASDESGADGPANPAGDEADTGAAPSATGLRVDPAAVDPAEVAADDVDRYLGRHVEDGVEWALVNDRPWRILRQDGEVVDDGGPADPERLSFSVVADIIVDYEWS